MGHSSVSILTINTTVLIRVKVMEYHRRQDPAALSEHLAPTVEPVD
jgi:hypothetical protein